jgi:hypothetical protein
MIACSCSKVCVRGAFHSLATARKLVAAVRTLMRHAACALALCACERSMRYDTSAAVLYAAAALSHELRYQLRIALLLLLYMCTLYLL